MASYTRSSPQGPGPKSARLQQVMANQNVNVDK